VGLINRARKQTGKSVQIRQIHVIRVPLALMNTNSLKILFKIKKEFMMKSNKKRLRTSCIVVKSIYYRKFDKTLLSQYYEKEYRSMMQILTHNLDKGTHSPTRSY
jgi:hypothetical protein